MMTTETIIKTAAKLYEYREAAKNYFKDEYTESLKPYTAILKKEMEINSVDEIIALLRLSKTTFYRDNGMAQLLFIAAVVELIEPSTATV